MNPVLSNFKEVVADKPADLIIKQIKELLMTGQLQPGDRLPPERKLSERFGVGRTHVREAIRKLEFYGILKTRPQSGTFVASIGISALESLIADVLRIDSTSFLSLVETRVLLEVSSIQMACERHTPADLRNISKALDAYLEKTAAGLKCVEEDFLFHLAIAEAGKNQVLKSLLLIIVPDILSNYSIFKVCDTVSDKAVSEHRQMLEAIRDRDAARATVLMQEHLRGVMDFARALIQ